MPQRTVSLIPSATEIVAAIAEAAGGGLEAALVGRSHECDTPAAAGVPPLTAQRTPHYADCTPNDSASPSASATIDQAVREATAAARSLYHLDADRLRALRPDLVITQNLCSVCSIDLESVQQALRACSPQPRVLSLDPHTLDALLDDILLVAEAMHAPEAGEAVVHRLRHRIADAQQHAHPYAPGPVVGFMEWTDPIFIAGHWNAELIERAGGRHPLNPTQANRAAGAAAGPLASGRRAGPSITVPPEAFAATQPELIVIAPCGLDLQQAHDEAQRLTDQPWFAQTPAARTGRVAVVDGNAMFNRPGPRLVDALEFLTGLINDRPALIPQDFPWSWLGIPPRT